jgi:K+-transporting ATPase A subunit
MIIILKVLCIILAIGIIPFSVAMVWGHLITADTNSWQYKVCMAEIYLGIFVSVIMFIVATMKFIGI